MFGVFALARTPSGLAPFEASGRVQPKNIFFRRCGALPAVVILVGREERWLTPQPLLRADLSLLSPTK